MTIPKELQELRANVETLTKKYKEVKAQDPISNGKGLTAEIRQ